LKKQQAFVRRAAASRAATRRTRKRHATDSTVLIRPRTRCVALSGRGRPSSMPRSPSSGSSTSSGAGLDLDHASGREVAARRSWNEAIAAQRRDLLALCHRRSGQAPARARSLTWVGASRSTLDTGTTITSFASRLRMSGDTTSAVTLALVAIAGVVVMNLKAITRGVKLTAASRACVAGEHR